MFHRKDVKWWEFLIIYGVAIICIVVTKYASESAQVYDTEYHGHLSHGVIMEEPYSYEDTCSRSVACGTDSKGNTKYCTEYYTCIQDVSRKCYMFYPARTDGGSGDELKYETYRISYSKYKQLTNRWKNHGHKFKQVRRDYYNRKNHGGKHWVYWDKKWQTSEPMVIEHSYENKVQASDSVFNFPSVSEDDITRYALYRYPDLSSGYESVTIMDHTKSWAAADRHFRYVNGVVGPKRKLRIWVLIFKNQPQTAAFMQRALWKGSNKNEFVYCIGTDSNYNITWSEIMTWSESHDLKIEARNFVSTEMKTVSEGSLLELSRWSVANLGNRFVKKDWDEFNYLTVEPTMTAIIIAYVITLLAGIGVAIYVVKNQFHDRNNRSWPFHP